MDVSSPCNSWCLEVHEQLFEDHFIDELIARLDCHLDGYELNWQNELVLVTVTVITMRTFTICNSTRQDKIADLAMKYRRIGEKWIFLISKNLQIVLSSARYEIEQLRLKMVTIGIAFEYNSSTNLVKFREYTDICIDKDQWLGTLTGLTSDLLLLPLPANNYRLNHFPYQKIIVPFRMVQSIRNQHTNHQTITINRSYLLSFAHQYFVFILNDRLKILQSTDSHTEWLYLALLHAMTSHPLSDQYTGMTGMRRAFQFLYSAGCWSDQPFDKVSLNILSQIASISPYS
ncbi:unnamed protein product [Rotaria sp. Silwood2]|nr:unnamed protein product [Rotaria sp. Silwood2]